MVDKNLQMLWSVSGYFRSKRSETWIKTETQTLPDLRFLWPGGRSGNRCPPTHWCLRALEHPDQKSNTCLLLPIKGNDHNEGQDSRGQAYTYSSILFSNTVPTLTHSQISHSKQEKQRWRLSKHGHCTELTNVNEHESEFTTLFFFWFSKWLFLNERELEFEA